MKDCVAAQLAIAGLVLALSGSLTRASASSEKSTGDQVRSIAEFVSAKINASSKDHEKFDEILKFVVSHHPSATIRNKMFADIYARESLAYSYLEQEGYSANFEEVDISSGQNKEHPRWMPVLIVNPEILKAASTLDGAYVTLLILFHEYVHYGQWKRSSSRERSYFRAINPKDLDRPQCEKIWKNEREAYFEECRLAMEWKKPDAVFPGLCKTSSSRRVFDPALLSVMLQHQTSLAEACKKFWKVE